MTFPVSPVNGEKANVNGITYTYDSGLSAWTVSTNFIDGVTANLITANSVTASGNVIGGNIAVTNNISAGGNLTVSGSLIGDGVSFADGTLANTLITTSTGNVGIGTGAPTTKLHVDQGADSNGITLAYSGRGASRVNWQLSGVTNEAMSFIHNNGSNTQTMLTMGRDSLEFLTNNTERMRVDSAGRVTMPFQPAMCRRLAQVNDVAGDQLIPWDTEITSVGITYNTSTRRFTVPISGRYRISFSGFKSTSASTLRILLGVNSDSPVSSSNFGHTYSSVTGYDSVSFDVILNLSANDYFTFRLAEGILWARSNDQFNFMAAHLIG
jgi:hypothetical protein